ncbi:hypothetical protein HNR23_002951 [Nocardiopsis mwathae]|uniref:Uncharacterized protein n=1 Tax=Nocardiopsis mwathae TaxID=1472723 RepID=A0A7W9YJW4_9ACTN|nr:hypothetical protein [Nocardiopsis mwathae]MBB6172891.1 hypothetical protein [Nocardiopsis mwathae]
MIGTSGTWPTGYGEGTRVCAVIEAIGTIRAEEQAETAGTVEELPPAPLARPQIESRSRRRR